MEEDRTLRSRGDSVKECVHYDARAWRIRRKIAIDLPAQPEEIEKAVADPLLIAKWREELSSLSFFHKLLKQKIARAINLAADATGHCWEGRFKSIVALDDDAVIAHMVYVALNPGASVDRRCA